MKWRAVYDPAQVPAHWSDEIREGQYVVFVFAAKTHIGEPSVALCENLAEAVGVARDVVQSHPDLFCEIYDHHGKSGEPIEVVYHPAERGKYVGRPVAKREALWGAALCLCASGVIIADFRHDLALIWGYVIGVKMLIVGVSFLVRGLLGLHEHPRPSVDGDRRDHADLISVHRRSR
jgi:hypothetical protein